MNQKKAKTNCPKCGTVYSIKNEQINNTEKKGAKCIICESRFVVENRQCSQISPKNQSCVSFLQSYFEKRGGVPRRRCTDRRKDIAIRNLSINEFASDVIPIFNQDSNLIVGHISPGRRQVGVDRRSGTDRRS
jgi:predicted Zn finger-like uncharacterized protein